MKVCEIFVIFFQILINIFFFIIQEKVGENLKIDLAN